jgi:hypothetical protein
MLRFASFQLCVASAFASASGCQAPLEQHAEVLPSASFVVVLSEVLPIPVGELSDQVILAGEQYVLISHLDSEGGWRLADHGTAELAVSPGSKLCEGEPRSPEHYCLSIDEPGFHALDVGVGDETLVLPFRAVSVSDIVRVELLQPDEEELLPGTWVYVDVVGVTENGTRVASIHPRFSVGEDSYIGYFAYQYDPDAQPQQLHVEALGWHRRAGFRGSPSNATRRGPIP